jgi:UDP-glucose:(heptosyl)LPS alpha-1,3-glucosyltransferase
MRIALVIPEFDPRHGGAENWTFQFARRLIGHGHEVHVVAQHFGASANDLPIIRHAVSIPRTRWSKDYLAFGAAVEREAKSLRVDLVHDMGHGWCADLFQPHGGTRRGSFEQNVRLAPAPLRGIKRLSANFLPRYRALFELERRQFRVSSSLAASKAPRFIALSKMVERDIRAYHRAIPERQVRVVYNGVDTERFSPDRCAPRRAAARESLGAGDGDVVFMLLAHNFRLKGVATAIRALARLAGRGAGALLVVVGRDRPGPYRRLARRLGCANRVRFASEAADPVPCYAAADAYVQPTFYDPCSLVVLEALACGLPVVTTACNGAAELLTHGRDGFVVQDPADDQTLAGYLEQLMCPDRRRALGAAARQTALSHTLERNYRDILALYEEILAAKSLGAAPHFEPRPRPVRS